jgi:hypothetical protein
MAASERVLLEGGVGGPRTPAQRLAGRTAEANPRKPLQWNAPRLPSKEQRPNKSAEETRSEERPVLSPFCTSIILDLKVVPRGGIEPPTLQFSVACSTN